MKLSAKEFVVTEIAVFASLIVAFSIVIFLLSNQFGSEELLSTVVLARLETHSGKDLLLTLCAFTFVIGIFAIVHHFSGAGAVSRVMAAVLEEMPRTVYLFGANVASATIVVGIYLSNHPDGEHSPGKFFAVGLLFAVVTFIYGCAMRYGLQRKTHGFH